MYIEFPIRCPTSLSPCLTFGEYVILDPLHNLALTMSPPHSTLEKYMTLSLNIILDRLWVIVAALAIPNPRI
jgi:hypothetical protein